ncbi:uncharacterized protein ISCGN_016498 [Ixodes scapularis]
MSSEFTLPSRRSLRRWLANVKMTPGIIPGFMSSISSKTKLWNERDRICTLVFDEMILKKNLSYDVAQDVVLGFADDGVERTSSIADRAQVFLLSGVSRRWVQPVAYTIGHTSTPSSVTRNLLMSLIEQLKDIGISIKAVVCDQGASNVSLAHQLGVSVEQPFFKVRNESVYFIFDVPNLIKTARNNLQAHKLHIGSETVDWNYIVQLYHSTHEMRLRLAPKLTDWHIRQKPFSNMKVKRATQVLSSSVCVALLALVYARQVPEAAMSTAYVCDRMDKLFDCLSSSRPRKSEQKLRYAIRNGDTEIVDFLCNQLPWVTAWKFEGRRQPQTVTGWQVTIRAVLMLWDYISEKYNFSFLFTRRLQQDALENIFWQMRQQHGCNTNPNVYQFTCGLKHIGIREAPKTLGKGKC